MENVPGCKGGIWPGAPYFLNEGHLRGNKRDGLAARLWGRVPLFRRRVSLDFGGGQYRYFDISNSAYMLTR